VPITKTYGLHFGTDPREYNLFPPTYCACLSQSKGITLHLIWINSSWPPSSMWMHDSFLLGCLSQACAGLIRLISNAGGNSFSYPVPSAINTGRLQYSNLHVLSWSFSNSNLANLLSVALSRGNGIQYSNMHARCVVVQSPPVAGVECQRNNQWVSIVHAISWGSEDRRISAEILNSSRITCKASQVLHWSNAAIDEDREISIPPCVAAVKFL
jgi:hypothetical protein